MKFKKGQKVVYVPESANGKTDHPDVRRGYIVKAIGFNLSDKLFYEVDFEDGKEPWAILEDFLQGSRMPF